MRILLDESLPRPLGLGLAGHDVSTVRDESWTSLSNGALLRQAAAKFDVLLTADQNNRVPAESGDVAHRCDRPSRGEQPAGISRVLGARSSARPEGSETQDADSCRCLTITLSRSATITAQPVALSAPRG